MHTRQPNNHLVHPLTIHQASQQHNNSAGWLLWHASNLKRMRTLAATSQQNTESNGVCPGANHTLSPMKPQAWCQHPPQHTRVQHITT